MLTNIAIVFQVIILFPNSSTYKLWNLASCIFTTFTEFLCILVGVLFYNNSICNRNVIDLTNIQQRQHPMHESQVLSYTFEIINYYYFAVSSNPPSDRVASFFSACVGNTVRFSSSNPRVSSQEIIEVIESFTIYSIHKSKNPRHKLGFLKFNSLKSSVICRSLKVMSVVSVTTNSSGLYLQ